MGTLVIHLKKKQKGIWKKLVEDKFNASNLQMKVWWELADVYPRAMQKYNQLIDKEDDKDKVGDGYSKTSAGKSATAAKIYTKQEKDVMKKKWIKWLSSFQ